MTIYAFEGKIPQIDLLAYVHESANIIGDVIIGQECFIGAGAIVRGDYGGIRIGSRTAIEEGCIIHAPPDELCEIGSDVIIGHGAIIHCAKVENFSFIGMGAILSIRAVVGEWAVIGEGAILTQNQLIPPGKVVVGNPARIIRDIAEEQRELHKYGKEIYVGLSKRYREGLQKL